MEYIVDGAEPNNTVLKSVTPNGYEHEKWLPVLGPIVRCKDCKFYTDQPGISGEKPNREYCYKYSDWDSEWDYDRYHYVEPNGFCAWGERKDDVK